MARAWQTGRNHLRESAGARLFDQWLKPMALIDSAEPDVVRLSLPSPFMTNWVRSHYAERLFQEFRAQVPTVRQVSIETLRAAPEPAVRSEEHTSELQSLMRNSYAVFCLKK